ncbi:uncharacterized protein TRUGW13939_01581 [Talaromyces rugulosus]|uniref:F-box domain-containing protein n=1 Tax=Talaromyces rugulosus TaxID=121627 RepID=A0A7H8QKR6_TALRU|nr:uncharacterized protein TRUGW13939_01581 [Talaromyces rugulosus]QKX54494.1 hypothetical protein TRUGW13939_01581 [Talaromyces rugulosus]
MPYGGNELTYASPNIEDYTLDHIRYVHLDKGQRGHLVPTQRLGALELLHMVLIQLDIPSLTAFRRVNRRATSIVDLVPQYKAITTHAPVTLWGIFTIGTGRWISCQDLYEKLSTAECESCGDFGGYLYLITCCRVCFLCFTVKADYLPLRQADATRKFGLDRSHLENLPTMKTVPGYYSPREIKLRDRLTLVDYRAARRTGIAIHGSESKMNEHSVHIQAKKLEKYNLRRSKHTAGAANPNPRRPRTEDEFDGYSSNPKRFVAIVRAPFLNPGATSLEWGFHCSACRSHHYNRPLHWRRKFTKDSLKAHIEECGEIVDGKHVRQQLI